MLTIYIAGAALVMAWLFFACSKPNLPKVIFVGALWPAFVALIVIDITVITVRTFIKLSTTHKK